MNSIDFFDKHLDPPDGPTHWECDNCHERFDGGDLTKINDRWYCSGCVDEIEEGADND